MESQHSPPSPRYHDYCPRYRLSNGYAMVVLPWVSNGDSDWDLNPWPYWESNSGSHQGRYYTCHTSPEKQTMLPNQNTACIWTSRHKENKEQQQTATTKQVKISPGTINIACDEIATATACQGLINQGAHPPLPPLLLPPYKGSRAMLQINGTWITAHHKGNLYKARQTKPMEEYLKKKYNWNDSTPNNIHWPSIKTTRQKLSRTKQMQTCKIMHGWLPVAYMQHHITGINQCPGCKCTDKTLDHLLQCPHPLLTEQRRVVFTKMTTTGIKQKIPKNVLNTITQTLATHTRGVVDRPQI